MNYTKRSDTIVLAFRQIKELGFFLENQSILFWGPINCLEPQNSYLALQISLSTDHAKKIVTLPSVVPRP